MGDRRLAHSGIDEIYASTSGRAILTAKPLSEISKLEIKELDWANEKYAGQEFGIRKKWCYWDKETRGVFMSEEVRLLGREWYKHPFFATHFDICTTGVTVIDFGLSSKEPLIPVVKTHSDMSHIYGDGLPTRYNNMGII